MLVYGLSFLHTTQRGRCVLAQGADVRMRTEIAGGWAFMLEAVLVTARWYLEVAPLLSPRCAEGEVPTAANLNLCEGEVSRGIATTRTVQVTR